MIEIKIPKEVTKYEPKLIGPFTPRQCVVLLITVPIVAGVYFLGSKITDSSIAAYFALPFAGIGAAFGWYKPYGLPFEKYLRSVFFSSFFAPAERVYKTNNFYDILSKDVYKLTPENEIYIDAILEGLSEEDIENLQKELRLEQKKQKKQPEKKYKPSKKAIF